MRCCMIIVGPSGLPPLFQARRRAERACPPNSPPMMVFPSNKAESGWRGHVKSRYGKFRRRKLAVPGLDY
jgi:hypothetical protein